MRPRAGGASRGAAPGRPRPRSRPGCWSTSCATRHARARNFCAPVVETSSQLMSSSTGPAKAIATRTASAPGSTMLEANSTRLPLLLDIFEPPSSTMPWLIEARERLGEVDEAHVEQHLGDEARVQQVQDGVLDAADVGVDGRPACRPPRDEKASVGVVRREEAQEVPRAVDEGVHRVGVAQRGLAGLRIGRRHPLGRRRPAATCPSA